MILLVLLLFCSLVVIIIFAFPILSPIPYFPSNKKDLPLILKMLGLQNNQVVVDLGAGDGLVIFAAAAEAKRRNLNTRFIATEINPILYLILYLRRLRHPNHKHIRIMFANMFSMNYSKLRTTNDELVIYLYISPWLIEKTIAAIKKYHKKFMVVSYMYEIPKRRSMQKRKGKHVIYKYEYV